MYKDINEFAKFDTLMSLADLQAHAKKSCFHVAIMKQMKKTLKFLTFTLKFKVEDIGDIVEVQ